MEEYFANINIEEHFGTIVPKDGDVKTKMILPDYQRMYEWEMKQDENHIDIIIRIPDGLNSESVNVDINESYLSVCYDDLVPLLKGELYRHVSEHSIERDGNTVTIHIKKSDVEEWPVIIRGFYPDTEIIDPKSAYLISITDEFIQASKDTSFQMLKLSANLGYVASLCLLASLCVSSQPLSQYGFSLYATATEFYHSNRALAEMGEDLLKYQNYGMLGQKLLQKAYDNGYTSCQLTLGVTLSPLSSIGGCLKDPYRALMHLEAAGDHPAAYHELAMLYLNGVGVKRNKKKALELQNKALAMNPKTSRLYDTRHTKYYRFFFLLILIFIVYAIIKLMNKK